MSEYRIPGYEIRDHSLSVPLDWAASEGETIRVFAREVAAYGAGDLPILVFLQGGPGGKSPRPDGGPVWLAEATRRFRVLFLDQRGTGRSSPVQGRRMAAMNADEGARYLSHFRADSIVKDLEHIRKSLFGGQLWFTLGQSYGGFLTLTYLSQAPDGLAGCFITGGLPGISATADEIYRHTYPRVLHKNQQFLARYPQSRALIDRIADRIAEGSVTLPNGDALSIRRFQHLGMDLGMAGGFESLHWLFDEAFAEDGQFSDHFLGQIEERTSYRSNPLFAAIHEAIYAQHNTPTLWAAERILAEHPYFDADQRPLLLTGEMIYPFLFDEIAALRPFGPAAHALAELPVDAPLYDPARLAENPVPVWAAVYTDDMYVDQNLSLSTAYQLGNCRLWQTNEFEHNGLRSSTRVIRTLFGMEGALDGFNYFRG